MRYSIFHLRRQVEINVLQNGSVWRWTFVIDGHRPSVNSRTLIASAAKGLQEACAAARTVIELPLFEGAETHVVGLH